MLEGYDSKELVFEILEIGGKKIKKKKNFLLGWPFKEIHFPLSTSLTWNKENKTPMFETTPRNSFKTSIARIKTQLLGWS